MKNKILVGSLVATLVSFLLYLNNLNHVENTSVRIVSPQQSKVVKNNKAAKKSREPSVDEVEYAADVKVESGSDKDWAQQIEQVMGKDKSYQVSVQDLNSRKFARVNNTIKAHGITASSRLYLLAAIYYQEQYGKLTSHTAIKIKKADRVKGEQMLKPGYAYGIAYLKQAMMHGNKTAANALLRKVGSRNVNRIIAKMGATKTSIGKKFTANPVSTTTATDLTSVMVDLYQNKTLSRQYANLALTALNLAQSKPKLVRGLHGQIYAASDSKSAVAIVQDGGHAYCMSVWSSDDAAFAHLGQTINRFFK
ncbi:serine hydrolase [Lactobacillus sp. ESL0731]|uniref:serine hydrolase n=1 Tax=unclassified Lactobacillus TaxID=2620435 RepID=UPI0023F859B9|nr:MULTISPECIES: serine hydrolase [unclassified Lactobacillus]WEV51390.1 serine hydrolase [Lactobacillus sp. ESL0700]WEV62520.1 serine hydrolase [Lactobacillus sp. ESL0731]